MEGDLHSLEHLPLEDVGATESRRILRRPPGGGEVAWRTYAGVEVVEATAWGNMGGARWVGWSGCCENVCSCVCLCVLFVGLCVLMCIWHTVCLCESEPVCDYLCVCLVICVYFCVCVGLYFACLLSVMNRCVWREWDNELISYALSPLSPSMYIQSHLS